MRRFVRWYLRVRRTPVPQWVVYLVAYLDLIFAGVLRGVNPLDL